MSINIYGIKTANGLYLSISGEDWTKDFALRDVVFWDDFTLAKAVKNTYQRLLGEKVELKIWKKTV